MAPTRLIGQNYIPPDAEAKVTGRARFAEDFRAEGLLIARLLVSPMPHARVRRLDVSPALAVPGVAAVLTADEVPRVEPPAEPCLTNEPLYQGEPILAVAASDEDIAAKAIERIRLDLEPLPFVLDPLDSLKPDGPNARLNGNTVVNGKLATVKWPAEILAAAGDGALPEGPATDEWTVGDLEAGFRASRLVLDETVVHQSAPHLCLEPRSALAYWQNGKLYVHGSTQSTVRTADALAQWLGLDPAQVVVVSPYTGGGFGSKITGSVLMMVPALLAKKTVRPVLLKITRAEECAVGRARAGFRARVRMGFREDGRLLALDLFILQDNGPYGRPGDFLSAATYASLLYQPVAMRFRGLSVMTNTVPRGPQRAPGGAQIVAMLEPLLDKAARRLGVDRVAIRKINAPTSGARYGPKQIPVTSAYLRDALDKASTRFNWAAQQQTSGRRHGRRATGIGIGQGCYSAGTTGFDGLLVIKPDGKLYVHTGCGNLGTLSYADAARVAADLLGLPWERTVLVWGDTGQPVPWSSLQAGSQTIHAHTRAHAAAAMDAKAKLQRLAARLLGGRPEDYAVAGGRVFARGTPPRGLSLAEAAQRAVQLGGDLSGETLPGDLHPTTVRAARALAGQGLMGVAKDTFPHEGGTCSFVVACARVEVDLDTGDVTLTDYLAVADCGTVVHPRSLSGQLHGGAVLGFGLARYQNLQLDRRWGVPTARALYQAKPPSFLDVPLEMDWDAVNLPDPFNPVGARGIGEPPVGAGAAAVVSAIADALGGTFFNRTPITREMILAAVASERA